MADATQSIKDAIAEALVKSEEKVMLLLPRVLLTMSPSQWQKR